LGQTELHSLPLSREHTGNDMQVHITPSADVLKHIDARNPTVAHMNPPPLRGPPAQRRCRNRYAGLCPLGLLAWPTAAAAGNPNPNATADKPRTATVSPSRVFLLRTLIARKIHHPATPAASH
jgi:hypothetical protein